MTKEQEEAIRYLEKLKKHNKELLRKLRNRVKEVKKLNKYSLYKKEFKTLNKQLKNKDKIINLMADWLYKDDTSFGYGKLKNVTTPNEIKQYFKSKAEKE